MHQVARTVTRRAQSGCFTLALAWAECRVSRAVAPRLTGHKALAIAENHFIFFASQQLSRPCHEQSTCDDTTAPTFAVQDLPQTHQIPRSWCEFTHLVGLSNLGFSRKSNHFKGGLTLKHQGKIVPEPLPKSKQWSIFQAASAVTAAG